MKHIVYLSSNLIKTLGLISVNAYRRWISPRKGFRCAHSVMTGGESCSDAALRILSSDVAALDSFRLIGEQRCKCRAAYQEFRSLKNDAEKMLALAPIFAAGDTTIKCC